MSSEFFLIFLFKVTWMSSWAYIVSLNFLKNMLCWESRSTFCLFILLSSYSHVSVSDLHLSQSLRILSSPSQIRSCAFDWFNKLKKMSRICFIVKILGSLYSDFDHLKAASSLSKVGFLNADSFWLNPLSKFKNFSEVRSSKASE